MISTITVRQPHETTSQSNARNLRDSNLASAPLPIIPRRTTRSQSLPTSQPPVPRPCISTSYHWDQSAIDSDSSSTSGSEASKPATRNRRKRVRGVRNGSPPGTTPPKQESSHHSLEGNFPVIAAPRPLVYSPGMLRLSLETMRSHLITGPNPLPHDPRSVPGNGSKSAPPPGSNISEGSRLIIRKKSGQPVKSSLKAPRSTRGSLSVVTIGSSSKSEPPTPKVVHFDAQLEHVKLFLAEQKPLAVSRDGSPTEDTSGTDSDFPSFIYGDDDDACRPRKKLVMRPVNLGSKASHNVNVALEDFHLSSDGSNILGNVRVHNIAFAKTVVVRFTFDSWQTTSEVTARYTESINPQFDRFSFSIRLNDMLARIEGKTLMMAIRYNVVGQEYWDNNHCQDYVATFTKTKVTNEIKRSDDGDVSGVESLKSRLEVISRGKDEANNLVHLPKTLTSQTREAEPPSLKSGVALGSRYDFAMSLRNPNAWRSTDVPTWASSPRDTRSLSPPKRRSQGATVHAHLGSIPWPEKGFSTDGSAALPVNSLSLKQTPLVSPRDFDRERLFVTPRNTSIQLEGTVDDAPSSEPTRGRNHQRGYLDGGSVGTNSSVRRTPPGTPTLNSSELDRRSLSPVPCISSTSLPSRHNSFPPLATSGISHSSAWSGSFGLDFTERPSKGRQVLTSHTGSGSQGGLGLSSGESSGDSELSTSSLSTPTSSRSATPSPTATYRKPALPPLNDDGLNPGASLGTVDTLQPVSPGTHYRHFLSKFCFFTGTSPNVAEGVSKTENTLPEEPPHDLPKVFGATDIGPRESVDGLVTVGGSGASTPTIAAGKWGSRPATPVPL